MIAVVHMSREIAQLYSALILTLSQSRLNLVSKFRPPKARRVFSYT